MSWDAILFYAAYWGGGYALVALIAIAISCVACRPVNDSDLEDHL